MKNKTILALVMILFGTISIFIKSIQLPSSLIAVTRAILGGSILIIYVKLGKKDFSIDSIKKNIWLLLLAGSAMGFNWIFLFEAYKSTTVSMATLSYYFAPIMVVLASPFLLKEKMTAKKMFTVLMAMTGLLLIVNPSELSSAGYDHGKGIAFGLAAATLYASVIIINKFFKSLSGLEATMIQLFTAALVLAPYIILFEKPVLTVPDPISIGALLLVGIIYTGAAYTVYFTVVKSIESQSIAVLSYLDPITAVLISVLFLGEKMSLFQIVGGVLILGATYISEKKQAPLKKRL